MTTDRTMIDAPSAPSADEPPPLALEAGLRIDKYELIRELGRGGMGEVFLARDNKLGRRVAMKFLAGRGKRFSERFKTEARVTATLNHENIVTIFEVDEHLSRLYMVLEYVEGVTLDKLMADKRMPFARTVELIVPVLKALTCAHEANIVHRDLKPANIIVTHTGAVKVLDFGVAKLFAPDAGDATKRRGPIAIPDGDLHQTRAGAIVGTLPYMSPEQLGIDAVDHRSDLWAVGIILFEMLAGKHPLHPITQARLVGAASAQGEPMPSLADEVAGLPDRIVEIVTRCLAKPKAQRYASAAELLADLEPFLPARAGRNLTGDESPYPGLTAFQESDANRFFGRAQDIASVVVRLRDQPLVAIVGPSGVGKSSFVRAGVVPALKGSGDAWEALIVRPGRYPLAALATTIESLRESRDSDPVIGDDLPAILRREPGTFGARLRARARRKHTQILLFIDQHEELYTLVHDPAERAAFTACLTAAGDDPSGPLRVIVALRSDFLDRAAEDARFVHELTRGLVFLQPPSRAGLGEALEQPLAMLGYRLEPGISDEMLDALATTPGPLPLLQFTAARLWEQRETARRVLTRASYQAMGGVAGALATHADEVLATFSARDQHTVRAIFQRLVTPERTRAIVETHELREISPDVDRLVANLVSARLLVVQTRGDSAGAVELVHESLLESWPTLQRWLDENQEHAAFLAQVRVTAKQWDAKGRPQGLLWRGEALDEARLFRARFRGELPERERTYLDAVIALGTRAVRRRRIGVIGAMAFLVAIAVGAGVLAKQANDERARAEQKGREATAAEKAAEDARQIADQKAAEATRALAAEHAARASEQVAQQQALDKGAEADTANRQAAAKTKLAAAKAAEAARAREAELAEQKKHEAEVKRAKEQDTKIVTKPLR